MQSFFKCLWALLRWHLPQGWWWRRCPGTWCCTDVESWPAAAGTSPCPRAPRCSSSPPPSSTLAPSVFTKIKPPYRLTKLKFFKFVSFGNVLKHWVFDLFLVKKNIQCSSCIAKEFHPKTFFSNLLNFYKTKPCWNGWQFWRFSREKNHINSSNIEPHLFNVSWGHKIKCQCQGLLSHF